jgi:hypothetical protein
MKQTSAPARRAKSRNELNNSNPLTNGVLPAALKMPEARAYLGGLSVPTMHRLVERGLLRPNRSTRHLIFLRSELDRFLEAGMT